MKKLILLFFLTSCIKTEVIGLHTNADTLFTKVDTTEVERIDTTRIPIGFQVSVSDWEEQEVTTIY